MHIQERFIDYHVSYSIFLWLIKKIKEENVVLYYRFVDAYRNIICVYNFDNRYLSFLCLTVCLFLSTINCYLSILKYQNIDISIMMKKKTIYGGAERITGQT